MPFIDQDPHPAASLLRAVSDNTTDLIFVRNCAGELIFANPAAVRALGLSRDQALGRRSASLFADAAEAARIDADDRRVLHQGGTLNVEQTLHMATGTYTFATTLSPWHGPDGAPMGVVGISTDISARKAADDALRAREQQLEAAVAERTKALRRLANHLETVREEEKHAIARELHDAMGATLTSLSMHLQSTYALFPADEKWQLRRTKIQTLLADVVATTRRLQTRLRPTMLDLFGLKTAIAELLAEFGEQSGLDCRLSLPDEELAIDAGRDIALYRMLQELLNNVVKHAKASRVEVILDIDDTEIALTVRDNGVGLARERSDNYATHGLRGLRERAAYLGGAVVIRGMAGTGTTITIRLPACPPPPAVPQPE